MSIRKRNALIGGIIWSLIFISTIVFFIPIITVFQNIRISKVIGSILILSGIIPDIIFRFQSKKEVEDERILKIQRTSSMGAAIATLTINFLVLISIYNFSNTVVDVEWLWFVAYFTFALYFTLGNLLYYFYDTMGNDYED